MKVVGYIYLITNSVNGKKYVGCTKGTVKQRWWEHQRDARSGNSSCAIHRAILKHGSDPFKVETIEIVEGEHKDLMEAEIRQIALHDSKAPKGYNLTAGGQGVDFSVSETRERHMVGVRRATSNPEWLKKNAEKNQQLPSDPEWVKAHAEGVQKRTQDPKWQANNAEALRVLTSTESWKKANAEAAVRRAQDPEWQKNVALGAKKRAQDPVWQKSFAEAMAKHTGDLEWNQNISDGVRGWATSPEGIAVNNEAARRRSQDPEWIRKNSEAVKKKVANPEWQRAHADRLQALHANPEWWAKVSEGALQRALAKDALCTPEERERRIRDRAKRARLAQAKASRLSAFLEVDEQ